MMVLKSLGALLACLICLVSALVLGFVGMTSLYLSVTDSFREGSDLILLILIFPNLIGALLCSAASALSLRTFINLLKDRNKPSA